MSAIQNLLDNNRQWAETLDNDNPGLFDQLGSGQSPEYLWIGCADSRVPATQLLDLKPGNVFVHRNIANVIVHSDINSLSVIQYAVEVLKVKHVIICGHYGCGGVKASMGDTQYGLIDNWLRHIKDVNRLHQEELNELDEESRFTRLCELNVIEQVNNVCSTTIVQNAWSNGQELTVHGLIYDISNGLLKDLSVSRSA